jgi:hypothetical protein
MYFRIIVAITTQCDDQEYASYLARVSTALALVERFVCAEEGNGIKDWKQDMVRREVVLTQSAIMHVTRRQHVTYCSHICPQSPCPPESSNLKEEL